MHRPVADGDAISQSKHRRFTVLHRRWVVGRTFVWMSRVGVGEGLRAELGKLCGVGAAGRAPLHDAPNRKVDIMLIIITIMRI